MALSALYAAPAAATRTTVSSINSKMAKGAAWMVLFKLMDRIIGLASIVVLARLLIPADFGLVAMATAIVGALEVLGAFNFDIALIQRPDAERSYYDTAWTFNVLFGVACGVAVFGLAGPTAAFYEDPRLESIMQALALSPIIGSLENIGVVVFRKELQFRREFGFLLTKKLVSVFTTMVLAFTLRSYWALACGILTSRVAGTAISYMINTYRPRLSLFRRRELFHFSAWLFLNNILAFVSNRCADFIIGKTSGAGALGIYSIASEISNMPTTELVAPINRAVFPAYAKMSSSRSDLATGYIQVVGMIAMLTIPAALGIAATASLLVPLIFGEQWLAAAPLIQVIAIYGIIQALQNNAPSVYYALGKPRITTAISALHNVLVVISLIFMSMRWGSLGASYALLISVAIVAPINLYLVLGKLHLCVFDFLSVIWRPAFAGAGMYLTVVWVKGALPHWGPTGTLLVAILFGVTVYSSLLYGAWIAARSPSGAESSALQVIRSQIARLRSVTG
jgi:lipopolysaccharide exporter